MSQLTALATRLMDTLPQATDSPERLLTLTRLHLALYRLADSHAIEGTWGTPRQCEQRNKALFSVLQQKLKETDDKLTTARLLTAMYSLIREGSFTFDERREAACTRVANRLIKQYIKSGSEADPLTEAAVIRCLADLLYPFGADESDEWFRLLRVTVNRWATQLTPEGEWTQLPLTAAYQRIHTMDSYASMFLDETHSPAIRCATRYYLSQSDNRHIADRIAHFHLLHVAGNYEPGQTTTLLDALQTDIDNTPSADEQLALSVCQLYILVDMQQL